jgi:GTP-binding protein
MKEGILHNSILKISIIGRSNVGKSTLYNRFVGKKSNIVYNEPGTTRDISYKKIIISNNCFYIIDTGGFSKEKDVINVNIKKNNLRIMKESNLIIFLLDLKYELNNIDYEIARKLRREFSKKTILVGNKFDSYKQVFDLCNVYSLKIGKPVLVSSINGFGFSFLVKKILKFLYWKKRKILEKNQNKNEKILTISIIGKQNSGKSSFINSIAGKSEHLVSKIPGTTTDLVNFFFIYKDMKYNLIDTAGIRKKINEKNYFEKIIQSKSFSIVNKSDIIVLFFDVTEGFTNQDSRIINLVKNKGKPIVIVGNKCDLLQLAKINYSSYMSNLKKNISFISRFPIILISAINGINIFKVLIISRETFASCCIFLSKSKLKVWLKFITRRQNFSFHLTEKLKIFSISQIKTNPPTFVFLWNLKNGPNSKYLIYKKYLKNRLVKKFNLFNITIRVYFKSI